MHAKQMRKSGELYFSHPVAVAILLAEQTKGVRDVRADDLIVRTAHDS